MNNNQLRLRGACWASLNMLIGCFVFVASEVLPTSLRVGTSILQTAAFVVWVAVACALFTLPFSMLGGYAMTWLLQKVGWHQYHGTKVVFSGAIITSAALLGIFVMGAVFGLCSQGECTGNLNTDIRGVFHDAVLMKLLLIGAICGGVTALQVSRSAQRATA